MNMESKRDAQAIIDEVKKLHEPRDWRFVDPQNANQVQVAILPTERGFAMQSVKPFLDEYLERPRRLIGTAVTETLKSFCDMVLQHRTANTVIFASIATNKLVAVIDYHGKGDLDSGSTPSFCKHRIEYSFPIAPEFTAWKDAGQWRNQGAFAQFLDLHRFELFDALDIETIPTDSILYDVMIRAVPREKRNDLDNQKKTVFASPSDLMTLVQSLSGSTRKTFSEVQVDRFGGMTVKAEKESKIQGDELIPALFLVQIAAFIGGDKLVLPARIRAQVEAERLTLKAELVGVERVLGAAFAAAEKEVEAATGCKVFRGTPEA